MERLESATSTSKCQDLIRLTAVLIKSHVDWREEGIFNRNTGHFESYVTQNGLLMTKGMDRTES